MFFSLVGSLLGLGCGFSQQEWDQRARELTAAKAQADTLRAKGESCGKDLSAAREDLGKVQADLSEVGLEPESLDAQLPKAKRALQEFDSREGQIAQQTARLARWSRVVAPLSAAGVSVSTQGNRLQIRVPRELLMQSAVASDPTAREVLARVATATLPDVEAGRRIQLGIQVPPGSRAAWANAARQAYALLGALRAMGSGQLATERFELALSVVGPNATRARTELDSAQRYVRFTLLPSENETLPLSMVTARRRLGP